MKAVIFGANGQDGFYLAQILRRQNVEAIKISRSDGGTFTGDVADFSFVETTIKNLKPDFIFHFAANSTTAHEAVFENHRTISTGTINILESVYRHSNLSKVFLSGSAVQFENDGTAIDENTTFAPISPYAVARISAVYAARYYRALGLKIYVGYFFNHDSPRRSERHVNQKIARAAQENKQIEIGDASVKKEFNFAGDVVEAVWLLVNQEEIHEAVIGSGTAHSIEEWLALCFGIVSKNWRDYVTIKKDFKPEYKILVSNPARIKSLGWQPSIDINDLAKMMMKGL